MSFMQLVYVSDLVENMESEISVILESAVRHNRDDQITGMLLYSGGNFLQVLEGTESKVRATFERICHDPRYSHITVLTEEEVPERQFADWSMGYRHLGTEEIAKFPKYAPFFQFGFKSSTFQASPGVALELLELFGKGML